MIFNKLREKYIKMNSTIRCIFWFTVCNIVMHGITFISAPMFTRVLSENEYGKLSVYNSYQAILIILATWDIAPGAFQKGLIRYRKNLNYFWATAQFLSTIVTISFGMLVFIFTSVTGALRDISPAIWAVWFLYFFTQPANQSWIIYERANTRYKNAVAFSILYSLLYFVVPYICVIKIKSTAEVRVVSTMLLSFVLYLPFYIKHANYVQNFKRNHEINEQLRYIIKFQLPCIANSLSLVVLNSADRIMIGRLSSENNAAYYSVAYSIAAVISIVQVSINQVLISWRYIKLESKDYDSIKYSTNGLILLVGTCILVFISIAPEGLRLLFPSNYYEAVWCIPPVSASVYFTFLYSVFVNVETYFEKTKYIMYTSIICSTLNIALNFLVIGRFGYIACAYTTLISYILFSVLHYLFMKRICSKEIPGAKIFDLRIIIFFSVLLVCASLLMTLVYDNILIRYMLLSGILMVCAFKHRGIYAFIKTYIVRRDIR